MNQSDLGEFCQITIQNLIAELEVNRFKSQGKFNDHQEWKDNQAGERQGNARFNGKYYPSKTVQQDKGRNEPLVDQGNLRNELETPQNWDLNLEKDSNSLKYTISNEEKFTDKKYDILEFDHKGEPYLSPRGNVVHLGDIPGRPFKAFSDIDISWIVEKLAKAIEEKYQ